MDDRAKSGSTDKVSSKASDGTPEKKKKSKPPLIGPVGHSTGVFSPKFKYSSFLPLNIPSIGQKRAGPLNGILRSLEEYEFYNEGGPVLETSDTLKVVVLHMGSRNLRAGFNTDSIPQIVPAVVAKRSTQQSDTVFAVPGCKISTLSETSVDADNARASMEADFRTFMKSSNLRLPLNPAVMHAFNALDHSTPIQFVNDPMHFEWTKIDAKDPSSPEYIIGQDALELDTQTDGSIAYKLHWPMQWRTWNVTGSRMVWREDMHRLLEYALTEKLGLSPAAVRKAQHKNRAMAYSRLKEADGADPDLSGIYTTREMLSDLLHLVLIVPDLFDARYVAELVSIAFDDLAADAVMVVQESLMACCSAGMSTACVVDVGATMTSVSIVENGELVNSAVSLFGGDDVTLELWRRLVLAKCAVPLNLTTSWDWMLLQSLKHEWCTANECSLAVQIQDIYDRAPGNPYTTKHQVKIYSEPYMAPLSLFYPAVFQVESRLTVVGTREVWMPKQSLEIPLFNASIPKILDLLYSESKSADELLDVPALILKPLDDLVAQAVVGPNGRTEERIRKLMQSILLVGGSASVSGFGSRMLEPRLQLHAPNLIYTTLGAVSETDEENKFQDLQVTVVAQPRDMDPQNVVWKGAAVVTKLDCAADAWIRPGEWRAYGEACLRTKGFVNVLEPECDLIS